MQRIKSVYSKDEIAVARIGGAFAAVSPGEIRFSTAALALEKRCSGHMLPS
jgi:hypothetical protein